MLEFSTAPYASETDIDRVTGIGLMMAQALEANGATVYVLGRRQEILEQAAATAVC